MLNFKPRTAEAVALQYKKNLYLTNTRALQLFQLLRQGFLILIAIVLAKSQLTKTQVGIYEMLTYLGYLLTFFWVTGGIQALLALYPKLDKEKRKSLFFQAFMVYSAVVFVMIGGAVLFQKQLLPLLFQKENIPFLAIYGIFLLGNIPAILQEYFYLLQDRPKAIVLFGGTSALLQFLCIAVPVFLSYDFRVVFTNLALLGVLKWLWLAGFSLRFSKFSFDYVLLKSWWLLAWPLILYAFLGALSISVGPWFVSFFSNGSEEQFAIYRYGARELPLLAALAGALSSALIPLLASSRVEGLQELKTKSSKLYHILFPVSILLILTSQWWFIWVFDPAYANAIPVFNTFLLTVIPQMIFARTVLVALHDTKWIPMAAVFGILIHILGAYFFGQFWGLKGIAIAMLVSFMIEKLILALFLWKRHQISPFYYTNIPLWLGYTSVLLLMYLF